VSELPRWVIIIIALLVIFMGVGIDVKFSNLDHRIRALEMKP
jgi:hypothetical protein